MKQQVLRINQKFRVIVPGAILLTLMSAVLIIDPNFSSHSLDLALSIDLLLIVPMIYLLSIRKTEIPALTVIPVIFLCLFSGYFLMPKENHQYLDMFKTWILPFLELTLIGTVVFKVYMARRLYNKLKTGEYDFFTTLKATCKNILPRTLVMPFVIEISVFYYGFLKWNKPPLRNDEYTYHKESGTITLMVFILFLVIVETFVLHILISTWSSIIANILMFISIYSGIQVFGFMKSLLYRPYSLNNDTLFLRYGILSETSIALENIKSISNNSVDLETNDSIRKLSPLGSLESHNVMIKLNQPEVLKGLYGLKKEYSTLLLLVDDYRKFVLDVNSRLQKHYN